MALSRFGLPDPAPRGSFSNHGPVQQPVGGDATVDRFRDRSHAGVDLAHRLERYENDDEVKAFLARARDRA